MKVVVKEPSQKGEVMEIENNLASYQKIVGGYIEVIYLNNYCKDLLVIANDESKLLGMDYNFSHSLYDYIAGPCIFISDDNEGDFTNLTDKQINFLKNNDFIN